MVNTSNQILAQGNNYSGIQQLYNNSASVFNGLGANDELEFNIRFITTIPYADDVAFSINNKLYENSVGRWQGENTYCTIDSDSKGFKVRWKHGNPAFAIVLAAIIAVGIIAIIAISLWLLFKKIAPEIVDDVVNFIKDNPLFSGAVFIGAAFLIGGFILAKLPGGQVETKPKTKQETKQKTKQETKPKLKLKRKPKPP